MSDAAAVPRVLRYAAFTDTPVGGNPAGVVLDASHATAEQMQQTAAAVGFSETAFLIPLPDRDREFRVRYFSPLAEVPFCGHATIAAAVAHADATRPGKMLLHTVNGPVTVTSQSDGARTSATLTSVPPKVAPVDDEVVDAVLAALHWRRADLDSALAPRVAFAGAHHLVLAVASRGVLRALDYDFPALAALMAEHDWTTVQLVHRESETLFHARNPFPPGGVVEDPATGAAAAALGAYLRHLGALEVPQTVTIRQGEDMGRPSVLTVRVDPGEETPVQVTGAAVPID